MMKKTRRGFLAMAGGSLLGAVPLAGRAFAKSGDEPKAEESGEANKWAMVIDIQKCMAKGDCRDCMDACHTIHNVPDIGDKEEEIKWIWKEQYCHVFPDQCHEFTETRLKESSIPILCNHCEDPPCVKVCPTQATWKRELDGIVMMDMHRCIGCRYCVVGCPYGSRSFNFSDPRPHIADIRKEFPTRSKGVVEKCNFCAERLAKGEMPACVVAARNKGCNALTFGDLLDPGSEVVALLRRNNTVRRKPELGTGPSVYYIV
jgi:molybdopterin-containing oxidoreductase family iron-sulfur binding subunit